MDIEKTEIVYLDGEEYVRVFFATSFEDIPAEIYEEWKNELDHREIKKA